MSVDKYRMPRGAPGRAAAAVLIAVLAFMGALAGPVCAQSPQRQVPANAAEIKLSFAPLVKKVAPAVVNIYTRKVEVRQRRHPLFDDPFFRRFFGDDFGPEGGTRKRVRNSLGSGVIVSPGGVIVTNVHVVQGADEIRVVLADRREFDADVVLLDQRTDIAVLQIDTGGEVLPALDFHDSDALEVGDLVLAIGNPFGVGQTVTSGIVSALARTTVGATDYRFFIQTDAAINPGNSGGALVTMDGGLVGINTAIYSQSGGSVGIGFAVPSAMVRAVVAGMASGGRVLRPWLGAAGQPVTADIAATIGLERPVGVLVNKVIPRSPADRAGLRPGDVIAAVNGHEVADPEALRFRFATLGVGGTAMLEVRRDGRAIELAVALETPPEDPPRNETVLEGRNPLAGATVANLSPALADEIRLPAESTSVVVVKVPRNSFAARAGLRPGDIVRAVNGDEVTGVSRLADLLRRNDNAPRWQLTMERDGRVRNLNIGGRP